MLDCTKIFIKKKNKNDIPNTYKKSERGKNTALSGLIESSKKDLGITVVYFFHFN